MASTVLALVSAILLALQPAAKPDFSGEWKMNPSKSNFGGLPGPSSVVRSITHAEPSLTIVETQVADVGETSSTRKYTTDGTPMTFTAQGTEVRGQATWDGPTLVVVSSVDAAALTFNDKMTLSADRKTLTSAVHLSTPQGDVDFLIVFEKQ